MGTQLASEPTTASRRGRRGRRGIALAVLATLWTIGVVVAVVMFTGGTSAGRPIAQRVASASAPAGPECGADLMYLAAEIGTMPEQVRVGVIDGLSPQMRQFVDTAIANQSSESIGSLRYGFRYAPPVPDGPTLAQVLAAIPAADARAIRNGLSPETRATITAGSATATSVVRACP
jgi:hypothetical protein